MKLGVANAERMAELKAAAKAEDANLQTVLTAFGLDLNQDSHIAADEFLTGLRNLINELDTMMKESDLDRNGNCIANVDRYTHGVAEFKNRMKELEKHIQELEENSRLHDPHAFIVDIEADTFVDFDEQLKKIAEFGKEDAGFDDLVQKCDNLNNFLNGSSHISSADFDENGDGMVSLDECRSKMNELGRRLM